MLTKTVIFVNKKQKMNKVLSVLEPRILIVFDFEGFKWKEYMIPFMREQGSKVSSALTQKRLPAQLSGKTRV